MVYEIVEAKSRNDIKDFFSLPKYVNNDPKFVVPLNIHTKMMMGKIGAPEKHLFLAKKDGKTVARLAAKVHRHGNKTTLHFGFFECLEGHKEAAQALVEKVRSLYPNLPVMGPFHFRLEDPYVGVLVDGFQHEPYFLMPYNPPYYDEYLRSSGLDKAMDLYTYEATATVPPPDTLIENAKKAATEGFTIRTLNMKRLREEATIIARIFNDALSSNWGFEEFLAEQVDEMVTLFKLFIDPRVVFLVQKDGRDIACLITIPNYNPVIKTGKGSVTPRLIWNFIRNKKKLGSLRGYALGVLKEFHGKGIASLIVNHAWSACPAAGYETCEISWILASNGPMNELSKHMGGKQSKTYRIFEAPPLSTT